MKSDEILNLLNNSISNLKEAIEIMKTESTRYYSEGDNWRGNFHCDASRYFENDLHNLMRDRDTIINNMKIGRV